MSVNLRDNKIMILHDKYGNKVAMTEADAIALGYTYAHKSLKTTEKVNQKCSSTKANELADKLETEDCCTLDMKAVADMLRHQATEIETLKALNKSIMDDPLQFIRIKEK